MATSPTRHHPFLLVRFSDYSGLQQRAQRSPWREMKRSALREAGAEPGVAPLAYEPDAPVRQRANRLSRIFSTTALAYILDPANRAHHVARIREHMRYWRPDVPGNLSVELRSEFSYDWVRSTPPAAAFFNAVLALDIVHSDLEADSRAQIEAWLEAGPGRYYTENMAPWKASVYAARGIWALYRGDRACVDETKGLYHEEIMDSITADGVYVEGPGYGFARWLWADREHKHYFGDVLAYTGERPDWYREPKLIALHEWLLGYARTPADQPWVFCDTAGDEEFPDEARALPGVECAAAFSATAASYAAHRLKGATPPARLCTYLLLREPIAEAAVVPSRIFPDGGAFFREASLSPLALAGVLWNPCSSRSHNHKEVNALALAAYGCQLLRGAGYEGWAAASHGFTWDYVNHRSASGNVVTIDYDLGDPRQPATHNDHVEKHGHGVTGFTTPWLDYAVGDSGGALPNGSHLRHFLMVHSEGASPGYFLCFDDVRAHPDARTVQLNWHPDSAAVDTSSPNGALRWRIDSGNGSSADLTIFPATIPERTDLHDGLLANWHSRTVARFAVLHYHAPALINRLIATILYPNASSEPCAVIKRIHDVDRTGAKLDNGPDTTDHVHEADGALPLAAGEGCTVQAQAVFRRVRRGETTCGFMLAGTRWEEAAFKLMSDHPVTLTWRGREARVMSQGAKVTVCTKTPARVHLNGELIPHAGPIALPAGCHTLAW